MTVLQGSIQLWTQTEAQWALQNPVLEIGQFGVSSDSTPAGLHKVGDGVSTWSALSYATTDTTQIEADILALQNDVDDIILDVANVIVEIDNINDEIAGLTTTQVPEGTNLYFTNARVDQRLTELAEFTELEGLVWDGSNKYITLYEDLDIVLISTLSEGKLYIRQNENEAYNITINGNAFTINTNLSGSTMISYSAAYGYYVFSVDANPVTMIIPAPDVDGPIVVSADKYDLNTIRMVFDEIAYGTASGFTFTRNGIDLNITGLSGSGTMTWDFTILEDIENATTVTWSYDETTGDVEDFSGNPMETQSGNVTIPTTLYLSAEDGVSQGLTGYGFGSSLEILNVHPASRVIRSGLAQTITFNCLNTGGSVVNYLFKVWRRNSGTGLYSQIGSNIVIPRTSLVLGVHTYNIPTPFNVQVGDYIGFAYSGSAPAMLSNTESGAAGAIYSIVGSVLPEGTINYNWEAEYGLNTKYSLIQLIQL